MISKIPMPDYFLFFMSFLIFEYGYLLIESRFIKLIAPIWTISSLIPSRLSMLHSLECGLNGFFGIFTDIYKSKGI